MATPPWIVPDELWELIEPLLPKHERRLRYPGRKRLPDRLALCGILFVLHTGIACRTAWRCAASSSCCTPASPAGPPGAVRHPLRAAHRHRLAAPAARAGLRLGHQLLPVASTSRWCLETARPRSTGL